MMTVSEESVSLPDKSRSLRQSSVAKRLETESGRRSGSSRHQARVSKKRLSKYRRKTENAKERERMKKFNEAFENLRQKLPNKELMVENTPPGEKDTKVSALRSAIHYIKCLQSLVADCDAGNLDQDIYKTSAALDTAAAKNKVKSDKKNNQKTSKKVTLKKKSCAKKTAGKDKWTNYSQTFLKKKFSSNPTSPTHQQQQSPPTVPSSPSSLPPVSPGSPRDVNEVSLHISLLDSVNYQQQQQPGQVLYIFQVDNM